MLKDAQTAYDKILVEVERSYQNIKTVIEAECNSQEATISQTKQEIKAQMSRVDAEINFTNKARSSPINVKSFLSLQESICNTRESAAAIESLKISLNLTPLRFDPSKDIQRQLSEPVTFGTLLQSGVNVDVNVSVPDIKFPTSWKTSAGAVGTTAQPGTPVPATEASVRSSAGAVGTTAQQGRPVPATEASVRSSAGAVGTTAQQGRTVLPTEASVRSSAGAVGTTAQPGRPVPATEASVRSSAGAVGTTAQQGRTVLPTEASVRSSAGAVGTTAQPGRPVPATEASVRSSAGAVGTTAQPGRPVPATEVSVRSSAGAVGTTAQQGRTVLPTEASVRSSAGAVGTTAQPGRPVPATEASVRSSAGAVGTTAQPGRPVPATEASVRSSTGAVGTTAQPGRPVPATEASVRSSAGAVGTTAQPGRPVPATEASVRSSAGAVGTTAQQGRPRPSAQQASLGQTQATPIGTFNVKTKEDKKSCYIRGIAVTQSGQRLLVDQYNQKVKLFTQDMRFLSSVTVPGDSWDITMVNDREAVVTVGRYLVFLEVTDRQLMVKRRIPLSFTSLGITYSKDKLIVTDSKTIHALDLRGTELWSVGQSLFQDAWYVCSNSDGRWVAVTVYSKNTITLLDVNNGAVITSTQLENGDGYSLEGISVDNADNIYVCNAPNILVLSGDLKNEHVLCNMGNKNPQAIAYDDKKHQLIISHGYNQDSVSCLQLS